LQAILSLHHGQKVQPSWQSMLGVYLHRLIRTNYEHQGIKLCYKQNYHYRCFIFKRLFYKYLWLFYKIHLKTSSISVWPHYRSVLANSDVQNGHLDHPERGHFVLGRLIVHVRVKFAPKLYSHLYLLKCI